MCSSDFWLVGLLWLFVCFEVKVLWVLQHQFSGADRTVSVV